MQAAMYGGRPAESKYQQKDGVKSAPAQNEPRLLVLSREKKDSRMVFRVSPDPTSDKQWLDTMIAKGIATIKYQSAGKSKITIYDIKVQGEPSPVLFVCIDKADTNVIGYLTVLERKERTSAYLSLAGPISAKRTLRNHPDFKVAYKSSNVDGCEIAVYEKEESQYVCIQQGGGWISGDFEGMARERALEYLRAGGSTQIIDTGVTPVESELVRIRGYVEWEYGKVFEDNGFDKAELYKNGWNQLVKLYPLENFWKPGDYYTMGQRRGTEYNEASHRDFTRAKIFYHNNDYVRVNIITTGEYYSSFVQREINQKNCNDFVHGWNEKYKSRPMAYYKYYLRNGKVSFEEVKDYPQGPVE